VITIRQEHVPRPSAVCFLKRCCTFVNQEWQHAVRESRPDQGFEQRFRESCITKLVGWTISQAREMNLGQALNTTSGVLHEIDLVAQGPSLNAIVEMKNRQAYPPEKNDLIVFFAKIFDYLTFNPNLLERPIYPIFISSITFEASGLAACLGLGIHPVAPGLRPLPILAHNAKFFEIELIKGIIVNDNVLGLLEDYCARVNQMCLALSQTWMSNRCSRLSENTVYLKSVGGLNTLALGEDFRQINSDCIRLINEFAAARKRAAQ